MPFQINGLNPVDVPLGPGGRLHLPESSGLDGQGNPVGAVGKPWFESTWEVLEKAGAEWYLGLTGENLSADVTGVQIYNEYKDPPAWVTYATGKFHRPTHEGTTWGGAYINFRIVITELVES